MTKFISVAIDGPAGAGKSTVAKIIAKKMGLIYIDTGAMYRALTLTVLRNGIDLENENLITELVKSLKIELAFDSQAGIKVFLNGEDVTQAIRNPQVSQNVAKVAKIPGVRKIMSEMQHSIGKNGGVVMEGRDIGSKVLPQASHKYFLTASAEKRAWRRYIELKKQGYRVDLEQLTKEIKERDYIDSTRSIDPLIPAEDAQIVDSTTMSLEQVVNHILSHIRSGGCSL